MSIKKIILFEYDKPLDVITPYNEEAGIWFYRMTPLVSSFTDDHGVTCYYEDTNILRYNIRSLSVDGVAFSEVDSLADLRITEQSFFYEPSSTKLYVHFDEFEPPLNKEIVAGVVTSFNYGEDSVTGSVFGGKQSEPRLKNVPTIKKSIDPTYFGLHKYQSGTIEANNEDGYFDDWRQRNLFGQAARILVGNDGDDYEDYTQLFSGFIEDDERDWESFSVTIQDLRKSLTQKVATNKFDQTTYPYLSDSDVDAVIPVVYGKVFGVKPVCTNQEQSTSSYVFKLCDTTYNSIASINEVRVLGTVKTPTSYSLTNGTITLSSAQITDADGNKLFDDVRVDFTMTITNGVDIIKDLMYRYDGKSYISSFWDVTEVNAAQVDSVNTSLYVDSGDKKLSQCIEAVSSDISARMFVKDDGKYTVRLYDPNRTPVKTIYADEWLGSPAISNNGSEYMTSAIIKYQKKIEDDEYTKYENLDYYDEAFTRYKKENAVSFETGLYEQSAAIAKSEVLLGISSNVQDIIERTTIWDHADIEICDFVIADPLSRISDDPTYSVYEVLATDKDAINSEVKLALRYVKEYTAPYAYTYNTRAVIEVTEYDRITTTSDNRTTTDSDDRIAQNVNLSTTRITTDGKLRTTKEL